MASDEQTRVPTYEQQVALYNQAVTRANLGDLKGAIAILETLLKDVQAPDLRDQTTALLEKMRKDLARLLKSRH